MVNKVFISRVRILGNEFRVKIFTLKFINLLVIFEKRKNNIIRIWRNS